MEKFPSSLLAVTLLFSTCMYQPRRWVKQGIVPNSDQLTRSLGTGNAHLKIVYTGCGGLVIAKGKEVFMTDPYYTSHRFRSTFGEIQPDPKNRQRVLERLKAVDIDPKDIGTVLVSHSHYDHLEDLPGLLAGNYLAEDAKIIGSKSASCTVGQFLGTHPFIDACPKSYIPGDPPATPSDWIPLSEHMRVLPIHSQHADHFYFGIHHMQGATDCRHFQNYDDPNESNKTDHWREGCTYSYLVDVTTDEGKILRIFIQTSSCNPPFGFPSQNDLEKKPVDLAIICVASHAYAKDYPGALLKHLRPKQAMLVHWEDFFFRSMYDPKIKNVALTRLPPYMKKLAHHFGVDLAHLHEKAFMPKPLTLVDIQY